MLFRLYNSTKHVSYVTLLTFIVVFGLLFISCSNSAPKHEESKKVFITEDHVTYFSTQLIDKTQTAIADYKAQGLAGGVDGFNLRKVFPALQPQDFTGVTAIQGEYSVREGELNFTGNAASNSAVLTKEGFKTLLQNCSKRLVVPVSSRRDIHIILTKLSGRDTSPIAHAGAFSFSRKGMYEKYIPATLEQYINDNYPHWTIPERYRWHPKLFDKYRTNNSIAPVISGDFNCDGKRDYALLMDRQKKELAVILFLGNEQSFSSMVLTKNLVHDVPKIEYVLSVVKPGAYNTIDPDKIAEPKSVRLQCASVGIGLFKELYYSGTDVYYAYNGKFMHYLLEN